MSSFENSLKDIFDHHDALEKSAEDLCLKEFLTLKAQSQKYKENGTYPAETGQLPCNKKKNRFKDILPFEYTRVTLHPVEGIDGSDYINANYITGPYDDVTYIAAQGPLPNTLEDFWRMLWYHSIEIVVMACKVVEGGKNKCECYWPEKNCRIDFGAISVTTVAIENKSNDFVVRDFMAECEGEQQYIRQYHYTAWPDHGKPESPEPIIKMLEMVHSFRKRTDIPLVFHCSAGCGRTGTMVAIDSARTMFLNKSIPEDFSVHRLVEKMRKQRPSMVQAKDQYQFVFQAVRELGRRVLGFKPTITAKPTQANKPAVPSDSDGVYENLSAKTLPHAHHSKVNVSESSEVTNDAHNVEPSEKPSVVALSRTRAKFENTGHTPDQAVHRSNGGNSASPGPSPSEVPSHSVVPQSTATICQDNGKPSVVALPRTRAKYENIGHVPDQAVPSSNGGNSVSPVPSPSEVPSNLVVPQSTATTSQNNGGEETAVYGNTAPIEEVTPPIPSPRVKPRTKKRIPVDTQPSKSKSPLLPTESSPTKPLPRTPQVHTDDPPPTKPLPRVPHVHADDPPPTKPLPRTPQVHADDIPLTKPLPRTPQVHAVQPPLTKPLPRTPQVHADDPPPTKPLPRTPQVHTVEPSTTKPLPLIPRSKPSPVLPLLPLTSTPKKSKPGEDKPVEESPYSRVDISQIKDTGPDIDVLNESIGKKAPLKKIEAHLEQSSHQDVSKGSSIMDTLLSLLDEDIIKEVEERLPTPPPPPLGLRTQSMSDEIPPEIPVRTVNRLELVQENPTFPDYEFLGDDDDDDFKDDSFHFEPPVGVTSAVYEEPTPLSISVSGPPSIIRKEPSPPAVSHIQATAIVTKPTSGGKLNSTKSSFPKIKLPNPFSRAKSDKKKIAHGNISGPVISGPANHTMGGGGGLGASTVVRSASDQRLSSGSTHSSSRASPSHSLSSIGNANSRYSFSGDIGFGIRLCKPIGPRQEPRGWVIRTLTNSVA